MGLSLLIAFSCCLLALIPVGMILSLGTPYIAGEELVTTYDEILRQPPVFKAKTKARRRLTGLLEG